jgi:hypothetical protein
VDGYGGTYLVVLLIGAALVLVDGQLIMRHAPSYLVEAYRDPRRARQVASLVSLFFHLVMLGVLLLVVSAMGPNPTVPSVLRRLGVLLILTAIGHALTMVALSRLREQQTGTDLANAQMDAVAPATSATPAAVTDEDGVVHTSPPPAPPAPSARTARRETRARRG